ncbi:MAG: hypothetical protein ACE14M_00285 [Terriglobales bacterium]
MQFAKDTFYIALRDRLAALNPERAVTIGGLPRPAVLVVENEIVNSTPPLPDAFYVRFGAVRVARKQDQAARPLLAMETVISYRTAGSGETKVDRGRTLAALDQELLQICSPPQTPKTDYTQTPAAALGSNVLWSAPDIGELEAAGGELRRSARLTLLFFPEVEIA